MRYLILTDIHANLEALETVLADADDRGYEQTLVLGDLVGYGADPNAEFSVPRPDRIENGAPLCQVKIDDVVHPETN